MIGQHTGEHSDSLGDHVRRRLDCVNQLGALERDPHGGLLVLAFLVGSANLLLFGSLGGEGGSLLRVKRKSLRLPSHVQASAVVLDVAGRVPVQVPDVKACLLTLLVAFRRDPMVSAVHDWMFACDQTTQ